jgi:VWFA-related protein
MRIWIAVAGLLAASLPAAAQQPEAAAPPPEAITQQAAAGEQPQPPVFGVGVDIVALDASVVDEEGRPELGLGLEDFRVEVDGKPRRLASVEYVGRDLESPAPPRVRPAHFSSNEDAPRGRLVLLLVDRGNIGRGKGREVLKAAGRFLDTLAPGDRVGLAFVPGPGRAIEFTPEVADVRRGLAGVVGMADRAGYRVPLAEAVSHVQLNDRTRWQQFLQAQCGGYMSETREISTSDLPTPFSQARMEQCNLELENEATLVYRAYRERSLATQSALRVTFRSLERIEGPKTLVFISEGLGTESRGELRDLGIAASRARVTLFVILLDTSSADASFNYSAIATLEDREVESAGLYDLATQARGAVMRVVGSGEIAFQRIAREMMGYYLLGFEPEAGDRDGGSHDIKVAVSRPNVTVRARGLLNIPAAPPTVEELLAGALRSPLVERGLPIRATAYALRDGASGKVRLLIAAHVARASRPVSVGFALSGPGGNVVASRAYQGLAGGDGEWVEFTGETVVDPATYNLRLAVVDAAGRRGSVEHTVKAALVSAGGLEISDLVLAPSSAGGAVRPAVDLELAGGGLSAFLELAGRDPARVAKATVAIELAESADGPPLLRAPVDAGAAGKDGTRVATLEIAAGLLPPGDYTARAEVSIEGKPVAVVTRPFRIAPPRAGTAIARAPLAGLLVEVQPFDRAELLQPGTLGHFVDRLDATVPGPVPAGVAAAVREARQGRPEAMLDRLGEGGKEDARVAFLRGVSYYARGNLPSALTQLQAALRLDSELFPAAVYMGACYASDGKDLDAIGAWQTALIGDVGSPVLYALLSDALVRSKEQEQAVAILNEGLAAFPDDVGLRRRLGMAYAMAGRGEEALPLLTAWVDAHPEDQGALFATLALLFEGFSRETAGAAPLEERQRLTRYAKAYVDGKGPNRELIERWLRYLESRT